MAGTRLAIQTMVIVQLIFVVLLSVHHGFCRSNCKRGNLTKDIPLVPGLPSVASNVAVVQAQWWEDSLCRPITAISDVFLEFSGGEERQGSPIVGHTEGSDDETNPWLETMQMTLAVENATQLPLWVDIVSSDLHEMDCDGGSVTAFSSLLSSNPMDLKIIPPSPLEKDEVTGKKIWSHYKRHTRKGKPSEQPHERMLVVYIPSWMPIDENVIQWKLFDIKSIDESSTTMVLASTREPETPSLGRLGPLVEDWMARSIMAQQESKRGKHYNSGRSEDDRSTRKIRLTREFPIEHFMAVLMPLLFPLMLPFLISFVKEYKRYKELTSPNKKKTKQTNASDELLKTSSSLTTKIE